MSVIQEADEAGRLFEPRDQRAKGGPAGVGGEGFRRVSSPEAAGGRARRLYGSEQKDPGLNALPAHGTRAGGGSSHSGHSRGAGRRQGNGGDAAGYLHDGEQAHRYL